jgi:hypothetical protein
MKLNTKRKLSFLALILLVSIQSASANLVPKLLHFIWIGEDIPVTYIENIKTWSARNRDYKLILWSDQQIKFERPLVKADQGFFDYEFGDIEELKKEFFHTFPRLIGYLERESHGKFPNYAAASDILRLLILYKLGGVYIDTDEIPNEYYHGFGTQYYEQYNPDFKPLFFGYLNSGKSYETAERLAIQKYEKTGPHPKIQLGDIEVKCGIRWSQRLKSPESTSTCNDLVAAEPEAPAVKFALDKIQERYQEAEASVDPHSRDNFIWESKRIPFDTCGSRSRRWETIKLTGPGLYGNEIRPFIQKNYSDEICVMTQNLKLPFPIEVRRAISIDEYEKPRTNEEIAKVLNHMATFCLTRFPANGITNRAISEKWFGPTHQFQADEDRDLIKKAKQSFAAEAAF